MRDDGALERGRAAFERRAWGDAYALLTDADGRIALEPEDLERLATVAYMIGEDDESAEAWRRAHQAFLERGDPERAARCAFWLALSLFELGESARGGGWLARASRVLDEGDHDCVERGYVLIPIALRALAEGDPATGYDTFARVAEYADRFGDTDLTTLSLLGRGQARVRLGEGEEGVTLLDEAMVSVRAGRVSPIVAGIVYCAVIEACQELYDLRRAHEWTEALHAWCESQPDLIAYRGPCLVRRSEIMQLHGEWPDAMDEAERACERLTRSPGRAAAGSAFYQRAEIHRLRGEFAEAEAAYRRASEWGRKPQPGLALLRLAQGRLDAADAAIRRVVDEARERRTRCRVLPAYVEIMLAGDDVEAARAAADELAEIAADLGAPLMRAVAARARGAVLLAEADARGALEALRDAWTAWEEVDAPYDTARVRVLVGLACRQLGDEDTAEMELDAARSAFERLGAAPDLARIDDLARRTGSGDRHGLTSRELEVLRLVAAGKTNKAIAGELFISERTVERHVSNIFNKLRVSSRSAATAYAYEHRLV